MSEINVTVSETARTSLPPCTLASARCQRFPGAGCAAAVDVGAPAVLRWLPRGHADRIDVHS